MKATDTVLAASPKLEGPIRAEIFGLERLEEHGESLAAAQKTTESPERGRNLLPRVRENGRALLAAYRNIVETVREKKEITPPAEWILDNYHVVDEQLREIRDHLPRSYYRLLPKIASGHLEGYPRVYGLAWAFMAHTDSRFDLEPLLRFVRAYQRVQPLTIGELWAVAIHLRVALVENLRRLAELIARSRRARARADEAADSLLGLSGRTAESADAVLGPLGDVPLSRAFAVQLVQRLRDQGPSVLPAMEWLDQRLEAQGTTAEAAVAEEHQAQAAANVTVRNIITSMRWISDIDWPEFFEGVSLVDEILRAAPGFAASDFATRDEYRKRIEILSRRSGRPETEIATEAMTLARQARASRVAGGDGAGSEDRPEDSPEDDPGYYLLSRGRTGFEKRIGFRVPWAVRLRRAVRSHATIAYLGAIAIFTGLLIAFPLVLTRNAGAAAWELVLLGLLGLLPASETAVAIVQRIVPILMPPRLLPKLELPNGVPAELRTMVVVPTIIGTLADVDEMLERLEVHYLSNPDGHLHFAPLTDWPDAPEERMPGDEAVLEALADGIEQLNHRHPWPYGEGERFLLLHRKRLWNEREGKWIAWERKRGKLHELNRLLRGATETTFIPVRGRPPAVPEGVRSVITLDADTRLPKGTAYRLVGSISHPLNRPRFDPEAGRVVEGYAILQPRIMPSLPTGPGSTPYQRIISGPGGVDPYAAAVSDVYQDLFEEGSYTGKGIYDVDAFEAALDGRVPENALLSHDLFEGLHARAGLVTDVQLFEEFPTNYEVAARRNHRWVRGDWQLLPWILPFVRDVGDGKRKIRIPVHGRWKMIDNLRRSLLPPAAVLSMMAAWLLPAVPALVWTALVAIALALPFFVPVLDGLIPRRWGISKRSHLRAVGNDLIAAISQAGLTLTVLAHQATLMTDAILSTLGRLYVTRRNLLEWVAAAQSGYGVDVTLRAFAWHLRRGVILALGAGALVAAFRLESLAVAAPVVLAWALSPAIAWWLSLPSRARGVKPLEEAERTYLRLAARRTWRFFETFVDAEEQALPPDNFQEDPQPVVAPRTSPTNIGLYLLGTMSAHDFGWIGVLDMVARLEATVETMNRMRRFRGHFFNWYDIRTLRPLEPEYISTVDSGNLAGHMLALSQGCREILRRPIVRPEMLDGVRDGLRLLLDEMGRAEEPIRTPTVTTEHLRGAAEAMLADLGTAPGTLPAWLRKLRRLESRAENLLDIATALSGDATAGSLAEMRDWARAVRETVASHVRDLEAILPWCERLGVEGEADPAPTLLGLFEGGLPTPAEVEAVSRRALEEAAEGVEGLREDLEASRRAAATLDHRLAGLAHLIERMVQAMDFRFLFDRSRKLFSIGYRVADGALDPSSYDLLASEARLASFVAIAKGDVSPRHWFLLGRALTPVGQASALVSWSGSMFEYLMPLLVMHQPPRSLLDLSCRLVVRRQRRYGAERGVPWGVSESAYNVRDLELTYQYSDFGVPGLGLRRGLQEDVVVAPYATALGAMVDPRAAIENFRRLEREGAGGRYGFYEALDYTPSRLPEKARVAVVRAYMAHHQGMTLVSLGNVLHGGRMRGRFHCYPMVQATELLLQERTPRAVAVTRPRGEEVTEAAVVRALLPPTLRRFESPHDITPRSHLLSNGRYTVMVTAAGSGFSRRRDLAVTRWREDSTRDPWGTFVYLRDARTGEVWSAGFQPSGAEASSYEATYSEDRLKISQRFPSLSITLEIVVSPEDDAELRRVVVTNLESRAREIDFTSYAEVVLAPTGADEAHPAFSNLFVETEFVPGPDALLASRRPRSSEEDWIWLTHVSAVDGEAVGPTQYESDRARFLGRGRGVRDPISVNDGGPLSNTSGTVLDPVVSLRRRVAIPPRGKVAVVFSTAVASTRKEAVEAAEKFGQITTFERESSLAWTQAQVQLHHLRITRDEAHLFQRLANRLLFKDPTLQAAREVLQRNRRGPSGLWGHGISGDRPIALVRLERHEERDILRQLLRAHEYWRMKGLTVDLVVLNHEAGSYRDELHSELEELVQASRAAVGHAEQGGVFLLRSDHMGPQDELLLQAAARLVILAQRGSLSEQVVRLQRSRPGPAPLPAPPVGDVPVAIHPPELDLEFFNGLGGFSRDGREYVTVLGKEQWTPAPWINVVSNGEFGFQVSESGSGYTWAANSRENKLTPWSNDPTSDPSGEILYVRDDDTGKIWGPTPLPIREHAYPYVIRHGQGYSRFEHTSHDVALELLQFVPLDDPVKVSRLTLRNLSDRPRRLTVVAYAEWVLGVAPGGPAASVVTSVDSSTGAIFARNAWNEEFARRIAFADLGGRQTSWTGDRLEFLGRNATLDHPASLERGKELSGTTGAGLDPCAALSTKLLLGPGQSLDVLFLLGQGKNRRESQALVRRYRDLDCERALRRIREHWDRILGTVEVKTPDRSLDLLMNRWLLYQTLACRIQARSALYQSSGAYGFRDQIQDAMSLAVTRPDLLRDQILRAAARQFPEGDVQHWWHPPTGRGVRTRISDDRLWLPYAVAHHGDVTGDPAILDEEVPWIEGAHLDEGQAEAYFLPRVTTERSTIYEHCARAIDRSLEVGRHGLPLIGGGDWNDGMNRVGAEGRGESVWLGWFLVANLRRFVEVARSRGDAERAARWKLKADEIAAAIEREAWDGEWYRRAYYDDGMPIGSAGSDECRIDSIAQSWAVLSGAGDPERARRAMAAVERELVRPHEGLLLLFAPPFDRSLRDPGYIKGYLPGIRENGGQYTHAATWTVAALAELGEGDRALELFRMLGPIAHASRRADVHRYKGEPYAVAADIYSQPPHVGRAGWTWYTGAAGWLHRVGLEWLLGFRKRGDSLHLDPCIPRRWRGFEISYRHGTSRYHIDVENPEGVCRGVATIHVDGAEMREPGPVPLADDGEEHRVRVVLGTAARGGSSGAPAAPLRPDRPDRPERTDRPEPRDPADP